MRYLEYLPLIFSAFGAGLSVVRLKIPLPNSMFKSSCQATQAHGGRQLFIRVLGVDHVKALRYIAQRSTCITPQMGETTTGCAKKQEIGNF